MLNLKIMTIKRAIIGALALALKERNLTMEAAELSNIINAICLETTYSTKFTRTRGTLKLVADTYKYYG